MNAFVDMHFIDSCAPFPCRVCHFPVTVADQIFTIPRAPLSAQYLPSASQFAEGVTAKPLCLYSCSGCGHYQLSSEPVHYWREVITAAGLSPAIGSFRATQLREWLVENRLQGKAVLEVGCGAGHLLDILSSSGVQAEGIEFNDVSVKRGRESGRCIRQGYILDVYKDIKGHYDGFVCINFLEHAPEPLTFLRAIFACCRPGAVGLLEVPNFNKDIAESKSYNLIRDHLSYFTDRSLRLICLLAGFEVLSIRECWHGNDLEAKLRVPTKSQISNWQQGTPTIQIFSDLVCSEPGRIAVWGASHQALTLLAMVATDNVLCIADSAPFKHGKVDPVCGLPIIAPADMIAMDPDLIIIIAAGYSFEVKRVLETQYKFSGRVVILDEFIQDQMRSS